MVKEELMTVGDFLAMLEKSLTEHGVDGKLYWSEQPLSTALEKRFVAAIIHEALLSYQLESDEEDFEAALMLKDLYDCHTCVRHIAQIYAKGIMEACKENEFGVHIRPTKNEAGKYIARIWDKSARCHVKKAEQGKVVTLTEERLKKEILNYPKCIKIDVRDEESYAEDKVPADRINIPLRQLKQNPYGVSADLDVPVFLYCREGYLSKIAADILIKHGYKRVVVVLPDAE